LANERRREPIELERLWRTGDHAHRHQQSDYHAAAGKFVFPPCGVAAVVHASGAGVNHARKMPLPMNQDALECANMFALWFDATCRVEESGDMSPHSTERR